MTRFLAGAAIFLTGLALIVGTDASVNSTVPTVYLPLNYYYGSNHKISTNLVFPWSNTTIEVVFDQGSDNFWVFGPNSTMNWGCTSLFCQGPCNTSVTPFYDYPASPSASAPSPFSFFNGYGEFTKIVQGNISVNDTMLFSSVAGEKWSVSDVRVAIVDYMQQRLNDDGTCISSGNFDKAILGIAPFQRSATWNTTGPHVRQDLLDRGVIGAPVQSMWFDQAPAATNGTYTGGAVFGGIETSKFTGPLVKVPVHTASDSTASVGYYVAVPTLTVNGVAMNQSGVYTNTCLIDSGTQRDDLPVSYEATDAFYNATGIVDSPMGVTSWPGTCESIPRNLTIDLEFAGLDNSTSVVIKVPLRNYARANGGEEGYCMLNLDLGGCLFGAPFSTSAFFAADDERVEIALAQGGVSAVGSGFDTGSIVARIP